MRVKFIHPVIVGGTHDDGSPRYELCRMESDFEIPEYTLEEAPVAIVASGSSRPSEYFHLLDGKLYQGLASGLEGGYFEPGRLLSYILHNGHRELIHFEPFHQAVNQAAHDIERDSGYAAQVNVRRELLKREQKVGLLEVTKACMKAPMLRKWSWLSPDVDEQIAKWRDIAAEKVANIVMINQVPAIHSFEPCYVLTTKYGAPQIQVSSKKVYQYQVRRPEKLDSGLERLGADAGEYGTHYFSATEYEDAEAYAKSIGWKLVPSTRPLIRVRDEGAVSDDFQTLETVRHARMLLTAAGLMTLHQNRKAQMGEGPSSDPLVGEFIADSETLTREVLAWQEHRGDIGRVREKVGSLADLVARSQFTSVSQGRSKHPPVSPQFKKQLEEFMIRDDQVEVRLDIPVHRGFGR